MLKVCDNPEVRGEEIKGKRTSIVNIIKSKYFRVTLHLFSDTLNFR